MYQEPVSWLVLCMTNIFFLRPSNQIGCFWECWVILFLWRYRWCFGVFHRYYVCCFGLFVSLILQVIHRWELALIVSVALMLQMLFFFAVSLLIQVQLYCSCCLCHQGNQSHPHHTHTRTHIHTLHPHPHPRPPTPICIHTPTHALRTLNDNCGNWLRWVRNTIMIWQ